MSMRSRVWNETRLNATLDEGKLYKKNTARVIKKKPKRHVGQVVLRPADRRPEDNLFDGRGRTRTAVPIDYVNIAAQLQVGDATCN